MRILIVTQQYYPVVGGVPIVARLLATELANHHEVRVVTATSGEPDSIRTFEVIRQPSTGVLFDNYRWCDIVLLQGPTLRLAWPLPITRKPYIVVHHIWLPPAEGLGPHGWLRGRLLRAGKNLGVSTAIGEALSVPYELINNPYDSKLFRTIPGIGRTEDLVFLGRLIKDKGAHHLIEAVLLLRERDLHPRLTIVGDGVELSNLKRQCLESGLENQVSFAGTLIGEQLATLLNRHRILVVPSLWPEPFGVVALEAIACGCVVVGSSGGGLPEAIGPCGLTYPNGDVSGLASSLEKLLVDEDLFQTCLGGAGEHLKQFTPEAAAAGYIRAIELCLQSKQR
jgi:glycogen(starch) synthase